MCFNLFISIVQFNVLFLDIFLKLLLSIKWRVVLLVLLNVLKFSALQYYKILAHPFHLLRRNYRPQVRLYRRVKVSVRLETMRNF